MLVMQHRHCPCHLVIQCHVQLILYLFKQKLCLLHFYLRVGQLLFINFWPRYVACRATQNNSDTELEDWFTRAVLHTIHGKCYNIWS